ncbi:phospholipid carrier-dependent glycosyltransferase [candidate division WWE3 bacterium]|jgi:hypothetical protein|nr:phospholipid carrier-dependent glycosyltransferase [candidate division WWE3 bacterium]MBT7349475.1 phospholipid carrier-dependent glycosyltransferase [candidate division WWE3 bacterium]
MLNKIQKLIKNPLFWIVVGGIILRLVGVTHGFPFIFHPDEPALIRSATGIRFEINPGHFDWPHMHFYLNFILYWVFIKFRGLLNLLGLNGPLNAVFPLLWRDPLVFYFLSRVFDAFIGGLTAIPVFLAAKELFNKRAGYIAALVITLLPHHLYTSSFALIDIPAAFWVAWSFYFAVNIFKYGRMKDYMLSGLFVGFAASTKYNGGLMALMVPVAHLMRVWGSNVEKVLDFKATKLLLVSGLLAAFGFVLGTPFALFDYDTFSRTDGPNGAYWQFTNVGKVDLPTQFTQFIGSITFDAYENYGYSIIIAYVAAILYGVFIKREKKLWLVLVPSLFLFFYISGFSKTRAHYYTSVYPLVAVAVGYIVWLVLEKVPQRIKIILLLAFFSIPFHFSIARIKPLVIEDTRVQMYTWLQENVDLIDYLYYTSSSMNEVIKKFDKARVSQGLEDEVFGDKGYILVGLNGSEIEEFALGVHPDFKYVQDFEKVLTLDNVGRRGPYIIIYAYGQN